MFSEALQRLDVEMIHVKEAPRPILHASPRFWHIISESATRSTHEKHVLN